MRGAVLMMMLCAAVRVEPATVYLFRHCVRSIDVSELTPFSARPLPPFGVPKDGCLPRGLRILENIGNRLRSADDTFIVADNVTRNIDSAHALATGLNLAPNSSNLRVDGSAFLHCRPRSKDKEQKIIEDRLIRTPLPINSSCMVSEIDGVLGGKKHITGEPDKVDGDQLKGIHALASSAADLFLMQLGGGMEVGWGEVAPADVYRFNQLQVFDWTVTRRAVPIEQAKSSKMLAAILVALAQNDNTTTIFMGHDTDVNGVGTLLNIGWKAPPFSDNTTAPSVALRFESSTTGAMAIDFVYPSFDNETGLLNSSPVFRGSEASFCEKARRFIDWSCASKHTGVNLCSHS